MAYFTPVSFQRNCVELHVLVYTLHNAVKDEDAKVGGLIKKIRDLVRELFFHERAPPYHPSLTAIDSELSAVPDDHHVRVKRAKVEVTAFPCLNFSRIISETNSIYLALSRGKLNCFPEALLYHCCSFLIDKDLGSLAESSYACRSLVDSDHVWRRQTTSLDLSSEEIAVAGSCKRAVKGAHMNFYRVLYKFLSNSDIRAKSLSVEAVNLADERELSKPDCIQNLRRCLEKGWGGREVRKRINLNASNLTIIPGWIWQFFPKLEKLTLVGNRIKTLPREIFQLDLLRILDCSRNQLSQLPCISAPKSLRELILTNNCFTSVPPLVDSMEPKSFVSFSINPDLPLEAIERLRERRPNIVVEYLVTVEEYEAHGQLPGPDPLERGWHPCAFLEDAARR